MLERLTAMRNIPTRRKGIGPHTAHIPKGKQLRVYYSLYGQLLNKARLYKGFKKVFKAKGAAGIDGQSLSEFASNLDDNLEQLRLELDTKRYTPQPVRRVKSRRGEEYGYWGSHQYGIESFNKV